MIYFGCDYYPEQWAQWLPEGEARWETDARLMAEAGFNVVRLAEFAWGLLEPARDRFDFSWLDRAVETLARHGLQVVLCTPTPTPPPWLLAAQPDITQVTVTGRRQGAGTRREGCANHPLYRERSRIISQAMAEHYAANPAVVGWQTDNEFGCHDTGYCYCGHCGGEFHRWLQERYGDIEQLNEAWGGAFWGEVYTDWSQIPVPLQSAAERNPGHLLDYQRFGSDSWRDFHNTQIEILRRTCPDHFVTHNLMGFFGQLDYYDLSAGLDFVSWDNYHNHGATPATIAAAHDHMWGVLRRNFWVMEQQVSQVNWSAYNPTPGPGFLRLKSYQGIAHGADGMVYFRWRQALAGSEQYHSALLDHAGRTTMGYDEAKQMGDELKTLAPLLEGTEPQADVAILLDYDSRWALGLQPHNMLLRENVPADFVNPSRALAVDRDEQRDPQPMTGRVHLLWPYAAPYVALWERNVPTAIVSPESDLSRYKVVIAPFLNVVAPAVAANLEAYVDGGGTLIVGPRAGFKDEFNRLFATPQPGPLAALTGSTVRLFDSMEPERTNVLRWDRMPHPHRTEAGLWAEVLEPVEGSDVEVIAYYTGGWYANRPAITRRKTAAGGYVVHVGCMGGPPLYDNLLTWLMPLLGVEELLSPVAGVEVTARVGADGRRVIFVLNHAGQTHNLSLAQPIVDVLTDQRHERSLHLKAHQVVVFVEPPHA
jgi:beta-galactosidase